MCCKRTIDSPLSFAGLETSPISYCVWYWGVLLLIWQIPAKRCVTHLQSTSGAALASCIEETVLDFVLVGLLLLGRFFWFLFFFLPPWWVVAAAQIMVLVFQHCVRSPDALCGSIKSCGGSPEVHRSPLSPRRSWGSTAMLQQRQYSPTKTSFYPGSFQQ